MCEVLINLNNLMLTHWQKDADSNISNNSTVHSSIVALLHTLLFTYMIGASNTILYSEVFDLNLPQQVKCSK